ncbi:Conserved hypothetical protein [Ramlibacter tataouinensis TTB310]|uniref:Haemolysin-type calcium binding-related domain-containing protein n=1 Tax=Ramlibacter tataouinensis (strain ATCC BAA-407 / DSM 14655 / LMG 21543 / TTB310) TaxID=365046 RepID=F5Y535_RAMTT|nr:Conserved hypothetical protein [Ramlibacter tataouinensis TTB310]
MLDATGDNGKGLGLDKNLLVGDDRSDDLRAGTGDDVVIGMGGDDVLEGGTGADTLYGGLGDDLYVWNTGDGNDRIVDPDGGRLVINNGLPFGFRGLMTKDGTSNVWRDATGSVVLTHNSPWRIELADGSIIELGEDFDPAEWGITLGEQLVAPTVTIIGDKDYGPNPDQPLKDEWGNPAGNSAPNREDTLSGSTGNDSIEGLGGRDSILGMAGDDIIEGGASADIIAGGAGADRLFANVEIGLPQATADGNMQSGSGIKGDWLNGGKGDDVVIAGSDNDVLFGGDGRDVLVGGAGADVMNGDDDYTASSFDWTVTDYGNPFDRIWGPVTIDNPSAGAADVLYGGEGNDFLAGLYGDDVLYGESGNDSLGGQGGDDMLFGGTGDDQLTGEYGKLTYDSGAGTVISGNDYLDGEDGHDWLQGEGGDDDLFGGRGNDVLYGDASYSDGMTGRDYLDGEDGNDELVGGSLDDELFGGDGNDTLFGDADWISVEQHGSDYLDGEAGDDYLRGYAGDDQMFGGGGADTLHGEAGKDYLDGEEDNDLLVSGEGDDTLYGGGGKDELQGGTGNDQLSGDAGNDRLFGEDGDDYLDGGDDNDSLVGGNGNDSVFGGAGNDQLFGLAGLDYLDGESGSDELQGGTEADVLYGGTEDDLLFGKAGNDTLDGESGNDQVQGGDGNDVVSGGDGADLVVADAGNDTLHGDGGQDELQAGIGDDVLYGGEGNDVLFGMDGLDTLDGGAGNDSLQGDAGVDTYVFSRGGGHDSIYNYEQNGGATDVLQFADVAAGDVYAYRDGLDQVYRIKGTDDAIRVKNYHAITRSVYNPNNYSYTYYYDYRVEQVKFADGTTWTPDTTPMYVAGALGSVMSPYGTTKNDTFAPSVTGGTFYGRSGSDTYEWGLRTGKTFVSDETNNIDVNAIMVDASVSSSSVSVRRDGTDAILTIQNSPDELRVEGAVISNRGVFQVKFADGVVWNLHDFFARTTEGSEEIFGTGGNESIDGLGGSDTIDAAWGVDTVRGGEGDDKITVHGGLAYGDGGSDTIFANSRATVDGGDGNDTITSSSNSGTVLYGGAGNDRLNLNAYYAESVYGGTGDDTYNTPGATIVEYANEGRDTVISEYDYTLGANLENLTIRYSGWGTGNVLDNVLTGGMYDNTLVGAVGNDTLDGAAGYDRLDGGAGDDTYLFSRGGQADAVVNETEATGTMDRIVFAAGIAASDIAVQRSGNDLTLVLHGTGDQVRVSGYFATASSIEQVQFADGTVWDAATIQTLVSFVPTEDNDVLGGTSGADSINALGGNDTVSGLAGDDTLDGGAGIDSLTGGAGNDLYLVDNASDAVSELSGEGVDTVRSSVSYSLSGEVENLTLTGSALAGTGNALDNAIVGNGGSNTLTGWFGNDTLDGGAGSDSLVGGIGNDTYLVDSTTDVVVENAGEGTDTVQAAYNYTLGASTENLVLAGGATTGTGNGLANVITGNAYDNTLSGMAGDDTMAGSAGSDTYIVSESGDVVVEGAGEGVDVVQSSVTYTLSANVENLTLTGTAAVNGTGNAMANTLTGNSGANVLAGGAGNDYYVMSTGDSVVENADEGTDTVQTDIGVSALWANVENVTLTGSGRVGVTGNALGNVIIGNVANNALSGGDGDDRLEGGGGTDTLTGGAGNDYFVIDDSRDTVTEVAGQGTDTIETSFNYTLGTTNVVENLVLTGAATTGTGNGLANVLTGNGLSNTLSGLTGNDTMIGNGGDDTYIVAETGDVVVENEGEGTDVVQSSVTYTLSANIENLTLTGTGAADGTGNSLDNVLTGNSAANTLAGGAGNDTYVIGANDVVTENVNEGVDTVQSSVTFTLGSNLENLTLTGTSVINGTGNALDNVLTGNSAANVLVGGQGNDTYFIGSGDTVTETAGEGIDTVMSSVTYTLGLHVENLTLTGANAINGTGNELDNILAGNSAANVLTGGKGNDTYIVSAGDTVVEAAGEGDDTVRADVSYSIATSANVENLVLTATAALNATGNALNNVIVGSAGNNTIDGGAGADTMSGGLGDDTYTVDNAGDVVVESAGKGTDTIQTTLSFVSGGNIENITLLGTGSVNATGDDTNNTLIGNSAANVLTGNGGNDTLNGAGGSDTLAGGAGDDTYVLTAGAVVVENADEGTDTIQTAATHTLAANVENLTLTGTAAVNGYGNAGKNLITGNDGANILDGGAGPDKVYGGGGNDTLYGGAGGELHGGAGDDVYVLNAPEMDCDVENWDTSNFVSVFEYDGSGIDRVEGELNISLMSYYYYSGGYRYVGYIENATMTGTYSGSLEGHDGDNILIGNAGNNRIIGRAGADRLDGGAGNDTIQGGANATMIGGLGNDRLEIWENSVSATFQGGLGDDYYYLYYGTGSITENLNEGIDTVEVVSPSGGTYTLGANLENLNIYGGTGNGNGLDNRIAGHGDFYGMAGNDTLDGSNWGNGDYINRLYGGTGNDTYIVTASDVVTENLNEGIDTVTASSSYTLSANVENLTLTGSASISGTGNELANVLTGNSGSNVLSGGLGDDTYVISWGDSVVESANAGVDTIETGISYSLANSANVENLVLTGASSVNATGNALNNTLTGNQQNNVLDGGAGADTMKGAAGNDTYVVDNIADSVIENAGEGTDTIQSSVTYTLSANAENLTLTGSSAIDGTGNDGANMLTGNTAANVLRGAQGDDTYVVGALDTVIELAGEGADTVRSSIDYTLGDNVENLVLTDYAVKGTGNALANTLTGSYAYNTLAGGLGDDTYVVSYGDTVVEEAGAGTDTVRVDTDWTLGANLENLVLAGNYAYSGTGNDLANRLTGSALNNVLDGASGADTMEGGLGSDTYVVDDAADDVRENAGEGTDIVNASVTHTLAANVENLTLLGSSAIDGTGNGLSNVIAGNSAGNTLRGNDGHDTLDGGAGADTLVGGTGDDTYVLDSFADVVIENDGEGIDTVRTSTDGYNLEGSVENLTLLGTGVGRGTAGANVLNAQNGGSNSLYGGLGDDTYVIDAGDAVLEAADGGVDTVQVNATYTLAAEVENLTLTGTAAANGTGNELDNVLTGNSAANVLAGGLGDDVYVLGAGDVTVENAGEGTDTVMSSVSQALGANVENLTLTGADAVSGTGNYAANVIAGNAANNLLDGQGGADTLRGAGGNDTYYVRDGFTIVIENAGEGVDTVLSSIDYTLGEELENLTLNGPAPQAGTGNSLDNTITGNVNDNTLAGLEGDDTLDGLFGADTLIGGTGDDTYVVDNDGDVVVENAGEGMDTVRSRRDIVLGDNLENLTLTGTFAVYATGNALDNVITGNAFHNVLDGGSGADTMQGGDGDDVYFVDQAGDVVLETPNAAHGRDTVNSAITFTLDAELENLTLTGTAAIQGTGNAGDNVLVGNGGANTLTGAAGNDSLDGGAGADLLVGGTGADTYQVDDAGDVVVEDVSDSSRDTVISSVDLVLGANLENLQLAGAARVATGNDLDNAILGNAENNVLDGAAGADTLIGGAGNDTYVVDNTADWVAEYMGEGYDELRASVSVTLGVNVEVLTLTGAADLSGTGNQGNNILRGNAGANTLDGGAGGDVVAGFGGTDTLVNGSGSAALDGGSGSDSLRGSAASELFAGGTGSDTLTLGGGADVIAFKKGDGADIVIGVDSVRNDTLSLSHVQYSELRLAREGTDLVVKVDGTADALRLQGWYEDASKQGVSTLQMVLPGTTDYAPGSGDVLRDAQVKIFDFTQVVAAFDMAMAENPSLQEWAPEETMLAGALIASSDAQAIGGRLAWMYAQDSTVAHTDYLTATTQLTDAAFGVRAQDIVELAGAESYYLAPEGGTTGVGGASYATTEQPVAETITASSETVYAEESFATSGDNLTSASFSAFSMDLSTVEGDATTDAGKTATQGTPSASLIDADTLAMKQGSAGTRVNSPPIADRWIAVDAWAGLQPALVMDSAAGLGDEAQATSLTLIQSNSSSRPADLQTVARIENVADLRLANLQG